MSSEGHTNRRIIIVDDVPANIQVIGTTLRHNGYLVSVADSGERALDIVVDDPADLILLDVVMPGMDGFETLRRLRALPSMMSTPVIFMSALTDTVDKLKGFKLGAVDYVTKPVETEELLARIRTHLTLKQLREDIEAANRNLEERIRLRTADLESELGRRKEAEAALRESEEKLRTLVANIPGAVFRCDNSESRRVIYISDAIEDVAGVAADELRARSSMMSVIHEEDQAPVRAAIQAAIALDEPYTVEYRVAGTEIRWVSERGRALSRSGETLIDGVLFNVTQQRLFDERLRRERAQLLSLFDGMPDIVYVVEPSTREMLYANGAFRAKWTTFASAWHEFDQTMHAECAALQRGEAYVVEFESRQDGCWYRGVSRTIVWPQDRLVRFTMATDITDRKTAEKEKAQLEAQLRHSQKMEAIGLLAGGVAHDFNNILTAILGHTELTMASLRDSLGADCEEAEGLEEIERSAKRATELTRQLLAFSRRQISKPEPLDLNKSILSLEKMLRRLLSEQIELELKPLPQLSVVQADAGQVEQVIVNLAVNARDAMPTGGRLTIEVSETVVEPSYVATHPSAKLGPNAILSVSDTGTGMSKEILERVFEPFFTTKGVGQGTGLGLATVYGIVEQAGGHITIHSELSAGTTFKVYFPLLDAVNQRRDELAAASPVPKGCETILLCEDDEAVRCLTRDMLRGANYTVLTAESAVDALELASKHQGRIDLLITDVIMPGMDGKRLAEALVASCPDMRLLFISGYAESVIGERGLLLEGVELLEKPFSYESLLRRVRAVLDKRES